jgi:hypothetical protein
MAYEKEQRESERISATASAACVFASPVLEEFTPPRLKNVSTKGIGLIANQSLEVGLLLAVKLANPAKNFTKTVLARVAHVTAQPGGSYLIGCTLDIPFTYEELCMLVM